MGSKKTRIGQLSGITEEGVLGRTPTFLSEVSVLVLLMGGIYGVSTEMSSDGTICIPCFMMISSGIQVILRLLPE
jgi:hypothetical protein